MRIRLTTLALAFMLLTVASPAVATPGNGAQVSNYSYCSTTEDGTRCFDVKGVSNVTETPSGNFVSHFSGQQTFTLAGAGRLEGCKTSDSNRFSFHYMFKDGQLHEQGDRARIEHSFDCFGQRYVCTVTEHLHFAKGELQFYRPELNCTQG